MQIQKYGGPGLTSDRGPIKSRQSARVAHIEDITRLREDMDFMFEWQEQYLTSEILFLPREHKIHIFELPCNVLFIIWTF